ncbi:MAG: ATP-binding protein [Ignavibacteriae bacterium]|nr:ATP-binding protein [Ignavibacteriota bacterium]
MIRNKDKILNKEDLICAICDFSELHKIRNFIFSKALVFGFDENEANKITLAVDEACTNLIKHSFNFDKSKEFCVTVEPTSMKFIVKILDKGTPFNPLDVSETNMNEYFKDYRKGGLGIQIMRSVMDEITYNPSGIDNNENILTLTRYVIK